MARGEVQKPLPRPWRTSYYGPPHPSTVGIYSPSEISPRNNARAYPPQPGALVTPKYGKRRLRLSLIPTLTPHDRSRPKVAPVSLFDAAAAVRMQNYSQAEIGSASINTPQSGVTTGNSYPPGSSDFSAAPHTFSSTPFSPLSSPEAVDEIVRHKGTKWRMLGNLFTRKPSMIFGSPTELSPMAAANHTMSAQPQRQQFPPGSQQLHRRPSSRSLNLPDNDVYDSRERSIPFPHRVQKSRLSTRPTSLRRPAPPPKDKPVPPIPKEDDDDDDKGPPVPPKVATDIPQTFLNRPSGTVNNVMNPRDSTLMIRRQAQAERLSSQNADNVHGAMFKKRQSSLPTNSTGFPVARESLAAPSTEASLQVPARRATLPSPTKSPSYSLFPAPSVHGSPALRTQSPKITQRSWAGSALSPGIQPSPISSPPERKHSESVITESAAQRPSSRQGESPLGHLIRKAVERPVEKPTEQPKEKRIPWPIEIPARKAVDPSARKPVPRAPENPPPKPIEKDEIPPQKPAEKNKSPPAVDKPMPDLPIETFVDNAVPSTIVEEDEEPEVSPLTESPSTPDYERWEPKVSPHPSRSYSLSDQETDPRDQAADAIMQITEDAPPAETIPGEVHVESVDAGSQSFVTLAQATPAKSLQSTSDPDCGSSLAYRASALKDQASAINEWKLSLNKPLPIPSPDQATSPGVAPRKQSAPTVQPRGHNDDIDWHFVSPRKASLPVSGILGSQQPYRQRQSSLGVSGARRTSLAVRPPPRASRAMPPRVMYGRHSAALVASNYNLPAPSPISLSGNASPASATGSPTTASPKGPVPNPLASAPTTAAEISIARQISVSRQQQIILAPVTQNVRPPQQAHLVVSDGRCPSLDSAIAPWNDRHAARQSHHVMVEMT